MLRDSGVHAAKPREKRYKLGDSRGLYLLVTPEGGKYRRLKFRLDGKERLMSLGVFPDVSLDATRLLRDKAQARIASGIDPLEARGTKRVLTNSPASRHPELPLHEVQRITPAPVRPVLQFSLSKNGELLIADFNQSIRLTALHTEALCAFLSAAFETRRK